MIASTLAVLLDPFRRPGRHRYGIAPGTAAQRIRWTAS